MSKMSLTAGLKSQLKEYLESTKHPELITTYLYYVEHKHSLEPVLFVRDKLVYQSTNDAVRYLEAEGKLWRETEIKIGLFTSSVDELTKKIYICPFTGKVYGDNTHPNPQDAIYDWVSKCPENTERVGGLRVKRFFISEDPEVIKAYASKFTPKTPITKIVFSSAINGKLYHSKEAVIEDFKQNYLKHVTLVEVQSQSRFQIEEHFMDFIQQQLAEDKIASFVEMMSEVEEFGPYVESWLGEVEQEA
ncbi:MAG: DUF2709 domain-containing protein [Verrucomicrobia bacterium]|nr:DUF2709 domain-containing protein [Verrucomicrobiota bacterium]MBS0636771.1 DUF2709 domain-containing protein [Verrucomicrobiota bacterium]